MFIVTEYAALSKFVLMTLLNYYQHHIAVNTHLREFYLTYPHTKVSKDAEIRNRYNQVSHLTQDTNGKVTNLQLDTTNESQEVSSFPAGGHKAHINRRAQRYSKHKTGKI